MAQHKFDVVENVTVEPEKPAAAETKLMSFNKGGVGVLDYQAAARLKMFGRLTREVTVRRPSVVRLPTRLSLAARLSCPASRSISLGLVLFSLVACLCVASL